MKEITIISGKGGTGKTSITAAFAAMAGSAVLCDNDVDASNLHLLLQPDVHESHVFQGAYVAKVDQQKCSSCGICYSYCRFDAIEIDSDENYHINSFKCEGCRLCERVCPENAISSIRSTNNKWHISTTRYGTMVHAQMGPGEENSGKLVSLLRKKAVEIAKRNENKYVINDGPPGIGCEAISSITGTDLIVVVTEPTMSGLHDLERIATLIKNFKIPAFAIINKFDLQEEIANDIESYMEKEGIELIAKIPFSPEMVEATVAGETIIEYMPDSKISDLIRIAWKNISN